MYCTDGDQLTDELAAHVFNTRVSVTSPPRHVPPSLSLVGGRISACCTVQLAMKHRACVERVVRSTVKMLGADAACCTAGSAVVVYRVRI